MFQVGNTYIITNPKVSRSNKDYGDPKNDYKLNFNDKTIVKKARLD